MTSPDRNQASSERTPDFGAVQQLFLAVLEQPAADREASLARAAEDVGAAIVTEVRRLLVDHAGAGSWLEPPRQAVAWIEAVVGEGVALPRADASTQIRRVGNYQIVREVGRGGMGVVFEAVEEGLGRRVALKVLPAGHQLDGRFVERFRREAQVVAGLGHDHIIPVYGAGEADGFHYYAMQFVDGVSLDRVIADARTLRADSTARGGSEPELVDIVRVPTEAAEVAHGVVNSGVTSPSPRPTRSRRAYVQQVASLVERAAVAVAYAHAHGVLHRDLKPSNLILDRTGKVWVGDFGLARLAGSDDLTRTGELLGTLRYLPPEALQGATDARGDVYALGLILYELLTLRPAFDAPDRAQLLAAVAQGRPMRPCRIDAAIPTDLETIVLTAIEPVPAIRYPSALALADDLRAFLAARPIAARPPSALHLLRLAARRHRAIAATVALALLVITVGVAIYVQHLGSALGAAEQARTAATREKGLADAARQDAEFRSYVAGIAAAQAALREGDVVTARKHLEAAPEHLRAWEWRHVAAQIDTSVRTFRFDPGRVSDRGYDMSVDVRFHPDGRRLLAVADVGIKLLDVESGGELGSIPATRQITWCKFVWGPRAESFVIAPGNNRVEVFSLTPLQRTAVIDLPAKPGALASDAVGARCAVGLSSGQVAVLDVASRKTSFYGNFSQAVAAVAFSGDGHALFVVSGPALYRVALGDGGVALLASFTATPNRSIALHPQGRVLVLSVSGNLIGVDTVSGRTLWSLPQAGSAHDVVFSPDGRRLAAGLGFAGCQVWELQRMTQDYASVAHGHRVTSVAFDPAGRRLATGGRDLTVKLFELDVPGVVYSWAAHVRDVGFVTASADGRWIYSRGERDGRSVLWDAQTLEPVAVDLELNPGTAAFTPQGELVVAGARSERNTLRVLSLPDLSVQRTLAAPTPVFIVRVAAAGDALFAAGRETEMVKYAWPSGQLLWRVPHRLRVFELSRDGRLLVGARATDLTMIDAHTGDVLWQRVAAEHDDNVRSLAFLADGTRFATVSLDRTLRLWDVATGACVARLEGHAHGIHSVAASPDGTRLVTAARDGIVKLWDTGSGAEVFSTRAAPAWTNARLDADGRRILFWTSAGRLGYLACEPSPVARELVRRRFAVADQVAAVVDALTAAHGEDHVGALAALAAMPDLTPEVHEGAARRLRCRPGEARHVALRIWRTVVKASSSRAEVELEQAHHRLIDGEVSQAEARVLAGAIALRRRDTAAALLTLTIGDFGELDARLTQTRLAFLALARAVSKDRGAAQAALAELDADVVARGAHLPKEFSTEVAAAVRGGGR